MAKLVVGVNDLRTVNPVIAAEWHKEKNGSLAPEQVTAGIRRKVWWKRECLTSIFHEWEASINSRSQGNGCSVCSGKTILVGHNDLGITNPVVAAEWHPTKNGSITPEHVTAGTHKKAWWERECLPGVFHEWEAVISNRAGGSGCPVCSGSTALAGHNDLRTVNPVIAAEWHKEKNGLLAPEQVTAGTKRKVWWQRECLPGVFHEWEASVNNRSQGNGCAVCSGSTVLSGCNDLGTTNPALANQWHPTKNGSITPEHVTAGSTKKVWWQQECLPGVFHEWNTTIGSRSKGSGCAVCSGSTVLFGHNDLGTTNPVIAAEWHPAKNGVLTPEHVTAGANKKVWWQRECLPGVFHEWEASINNRSRRSGCAVCSGSTVLSGCNDLGTTNPALANQWHPTKNGSITPEHVTAGSGKKVWWECKSDPKSTHQWEATIHSRSKGNGCPQCSAGKTETSFRKSFEKQTGHDFQSSRVQLHRLSRLSNIAQIDMFNDYLKLVIEYDGAWAHGENTLYKATLAQKLAHDKETTEALAKKGYNVIRIRNHDRSQKLPLIQIDPHYESNVFQITYKSFGKDRDNIEELVRTIIKEKADWFTVQ